MDAHCILSLHLYEKCTKKVCLICLASFQNCATRKKSHCGFKANPYPFIPMVNWTISASILRKKNFFS